MGMMLVTSAIERPEKSSSRINTSLWRAINRASSSLLR